MTAAEIIHERADINKVDMGLTNWLGAKLVKLRGSTDMTLSKSGPENTMG